MADTYEQNLSQKGTLTVNDYIRVVGSDNASYKQLVSDVAKKIIENYTGSSLAGSSQSVKSALDALNSKWTVSTAATTSTVSVPANYSGTATIDVTKAGYLARGVLAIYKSGAANGYCVPSAWSIANNTLSILFMNYSPNVASMSVSVAILYEKA